MESASSRSPSTILDSTAETEQAAVHRRRSFRPRRPVASNVPPSQHSELVDSEVIQLLMKSGSNKTLDVEDKPQEVGKPKVIKLKIIGPKLKSTVRDVFDPVHQDTDRIRILADVCCERLRALADVSSPSKNV